MMRKTLVFATAIAGLAIAAPVAAKPASSLRDLIGARGSSGEMEMTARGFVSGKSVLSQGGRVVFWGNASDNTCVKILTRNGRYATILDAPPASCGLRGGRPAAKASLAGIMGNTGVATFDIMQSRGFAGVDTSNAPNGDLVGIYYNRSTKQCVQVITANNKVVAVTELGSHPKCR